jgi:hypothetical protein
LVWRALFASGQQALHWTVGPFFLKTGWAGPPTPWCWWKGWAPTGTYKLRWCSTTNISSSPSLVAGHIRNAGHCLAAGEDVKDGCTGWRGCHGTSLGAWIGFRCGALLMKNQVQWRGWNTKNLVSNLWERPLPVPERLRM